MSHRRSATMERPAYRPGIDPVVDMQHVSVSFHGQSETVHALQDVSLQVPAGQIVWVKGENGSGKSTLIDTIRGTHRPQAGSVRVAGTDVAHLRSDSIGHHNSEHIRMSFQGVDLADNWTIKENLIWFGRSLGRSKTETRVQASRVIARLGIDGQKPENIPVSRLSGGQKQRVALGKLFVTPRELLLLDEPVGQLDPGLQREAFHTIANVARGEGTAVIMVSHNELPEGTFDRQIVMGAGRIIGDELVSRRQPVEPQPPIWPA